MERPPDSENYLCYVIDNEEIESMYTIVFWYSRYLLPFPLLRPPSPPHPFPLYVRRLDSYVGVPF